MIRLLRSRTGLLVVALVGLGWVGAVAVLLGRTRVGAAVAIVALSVLAGWAVLAVTRIEWLQRTQYRGVVDRLREVADATPAGGRSRRTPSAPPAAVEPAVGRHAARSPVDRSRDELLADLPGVGLAGRDHPVVAVLGTDALAVVLLGVADVVRLRPWDARAAVEAATPDLLVVEEAALRQGIWNGVEGTTSLALTEELEAVLGWCAETDTAVVGILAVGTAGVHTPTIRAAYGLSLPTQDDLRPEGVPEMPVLAALQRYAAASVVA